jgi:hypothetical protein
MKCAGRWTDISPITDFRFSWIIVDVDSAQMSLQNVDVDNVTPFQRYTLPPS